MKFLKAISCFLLSIVLLIGMEAVTLAKDEIEYDSMIEYRFQRKMYNVYEDSFIELTKLLTSGLQKEKIDISFISSNHKAAVVTQQNVLYAKKAGRIVITCSYMVGEKRKSCKAAVNVISADGSTKADAFKYSVVNGKAVITHIEQNI